MPDRLQVSRSVTFDATGKGVVQLGPERARERWRIDRITVQATGVEIPETRVYRGPESPTTLLDATRTGNLDVSETELDLYQGESVTAVWSLGSSGAVGTIVVEGERR